MASVSVSVGRPKLEKAYLAKVGTLAGLPSSILGGMGGVGASIGAMAGGIAGAAVSAIAGAAGRTAGQITFKFNPKELSLDKQNNLPTTPHPTQEAPAAESTGSSPATLKVDVFLDDSESSSGDITKDVDFLLSCCKPMEDKAGSPPPVVMFGWGSAMKFLAVVKSVGVRYTLFRPDGTPVRATCSVQLQEVPSKPGRQNPTSSGLAPYRSHRVIAGDSLPLIAYREYRKPALWRAIAATNAIDDPLRLRPGTTLLIPPPDEAARLE